jgi:hypothetical protein
VLPAGARRSRRVTTLTAAAVAVALFGLLVLLRAYLSRPFWYDEIWRAHFVSEPLRSFWSELTVANTPSAFGWMTLARLSGEVFGWHSWSLRLPGFVALPLLGAAIVVLARRFTGPVAAVAAACWLCLNSTFLDLSTQLKPYAVEALAAVAIVLLWRTTPAGERLDRRRLARRAAAGILALLSVPGVFVIVPLVALDLWRGPARRWRLVESLPALGLSAANTVLFVGHQSSQRHGHYWDRQFLAGRGPLDAVRFLADQARRTVTGSPPGIDRFDPSLIHGTVARGPFGSAPAVLAAVAVVLAGLVGTVTLARRPEGRTLLVALGGAELMMLAASAARYWPFGPTRTNLYTVPMMVVVVVVGFERAARLLIRLIAGHSAVTDAEEVADGPRAPPTTLTPPGAVSRASLSGFLRFSVTATLPVVAIVALTGCAGLLLDATVSGSDALWAHRDRVRGLDRMVDATLAARRAAEPGDVVAVGGRLARPGWLYAMEAGDDGPGDPADLTPASVPSAAVSAAATRGSRPAPGPVPGAVPGAGSVVSPASGRPRAADDAVVGGPVELPAGAPGASQGPGRRVARADTVFFGGAQPPLARQLAARSAAPRRLLVFVFDIERAGLAGQLEALPRAGWCSARVWTFRLTGTLTLYQRCDAATTPSRITAAAAG